VQVLGKKTVDLGGVTVTITVTRPFVRFAPDAALAALVRHCRCSSVSH
jgi:hypothetical protein